MADNLESFCREQVSTHPRSGDFKYFMMLAEMSFNKDFGNDFREAIFQQLDVAYETYRKKHNINYVHPSTFIDDYIR